MPREDIGSAKNAGAVEIRPCDGSPATQVLHLPTPHPGDLFGRSVAAADLNFDQYIDLVVGIPLYDVGAAVNAGAIAEYYGSGTGFALHAILDQGSPGVPGLLKAGAHFGVAVAAWMPPWLLDDGDPACSVPDDDSVLRIGAPGKAVGTATDAGQFVDIAYNACGPVADQTRQVTLNTPGIPGTAKAGDLLGAALWEVYAVGARGHPVAGHRGAGAVLEFRGPIDVDPVLVTQNSACMPGSAEAGDHFGASLSGGWIGAPGEDLNGLEDAGMVELYSARFNHTSCFGLTAKSAGFNGSLHAGDRFGAAIDELHYWEDDAEYVPEVLLIGAPGRDNWHGTDSGVVDWVSERMDVESGGFLALGKSGRTAGAYAAKNAAMGTAFGVGAPLVSAPGALGGRGVVYNYNVSSDANDTMLGSPSAVYEQADPIQPGVYGTSLMSLSN